MTSRGKFYKYTIVPLLCLVLLLTISGKSAKAETWLAQNGQFIVSGTTSLVGRFYASGVSEEPNTIEDEILETYSSEEGQYPKIRTYTYDFNVPILLMFSGDIYTDQSGISYNDGYLNGVLYAIVAYNTTRSGPGTLATNSLRCSVSITDNNGEGYRSYLGSSYLPNGSGNLGIGIVFDNFPILGDLSVCNIRVQIQYKVTNPQSWGTTSNQGTESVIFQPTSVTLLNYTRGSNVASSSNGIAGQIYSAIENSTSVSDIVTLLSLVEDAAGDINVAVSNINSNLIPSIIQYLQDIRQNTTYTYLRLDQIITYLRVISDTWPAYSSQVLFYLSQLVNMNEEQSSLAEEVESQYQAKASEGAELNQGMQVVIPSVDQNSFDINSGIDTGAITTLTAFWSMFTHNSLISIMFTIAIAGIAAGFFLYGKKG